MEDLSTTSRRFYDAVAEDYDRLLTSQDKTVRRFVQKIFREYVPAGTILDFGGGTGLDLEWMMAENYRVEFLEPSEGMRARAMKRIAQNPNWASRINVMKDETDIFLWNDHSSPSSPPVDGVLMNFAVLNCIRNLNELFKSLQLITKPGCFIVALILNPNPWQVMKRNFRTALLLLIGIKAAEENTCHKNTRQTVLIHSLRNIIQASTPRYKLLRSSPVPYSPFTLIVLQHQ